MDYLSIFLKWTFVWAVGRVRNKSSTFSDEKYAEIHGIYLIHLEYLHEYCVSRDERKIFHVHKLWEMIGKHANAGTKDPSNKRTSLVTSMCKHIFETRSIDESTESSKLCEKFRYLSICSIFIPVFRIFVNILFFSPGNRFIYDNFNIMKVWNVYLFGLRIADIGPN